MLRGLKGVGGKRAMKRREWDGGQDFDTDHYVWQSSTVFFLMIEPQPCLNVCGSSSLC